VFRDKIVKEWQADGAAFEEMPEVDLSPQNIADSQLQMMFAICHPSIPVEAQVGLSLRILCGFGIEEIADAFLVPKDTINKRLYRAKDVLRAVGEKIVVPAELGEKLPAVLTTIYLLFNEGYYSISQEQPLRKELCLEAIRLCTMLIEYKPTDVAPVNALMALMCFHASRFDARFSGDGEIILYREQDASLWDSDLIGKGVYFLHRSASGDTLSKYHLEAGIAYWNTQQTDTPEKWRHVLQLYNQLLQMAYSPVAALNRTYALSKVYGKRDAIVEAEKLGLSDNQFYYALLGDLYSGIDDVVARHHFEKAFVLAKSPKDREALRKRIDGL
jgi:RNA polymerase sigma-70 factor (ECF subfamily)